MHLISSRGQLTRGSRLAWQLKEVLTTPHRKNRPSYETYIHMPPAWADPLVRPTQWKRDMIFRKWDVGA